LNWEGIDSKHIQKLIRKVCKDKNTSKTWKQARRGEGDNVRTNLQATADKLDLSDSRECTVAVFREYENEIQLP
jgi:hypothetical protein